jgi:hypothetical protein
VIIDLLHHKCKFPISGLLHLTPILSWILPCSIFGKRYSQLGARSPTRLQQSDTYISYKSSALNMFSHKTNKSWMPSTKHISGHLTNAFCPLNLSVYPTAFGARASVFASVSSRIVLAQYSSVVSSHHLLSSNQAPPTYAREIQHHHRSGICILDSTLIHSSIYEKDLLGQLNCAVFRVNSLIFHSLHIFNNNDNRIVFVAHHQHSPLHRHTVRLARYNKIETTTTKTLSSTLVPRLLFSIILSPFLSLKAPPRERLHSDLNRE